MEEMDVLYKGQILTLKRFWRNDQLCLWIHSPSQICMPKMEFVGGHPNEYCIFLKNLSLDELAEITKLDGQPIRIDTRLISN